jgi:hypothetical protein
LNTPHDQDLALAAQTNIFAFLDSGCLKPGACSATISWTDVIATVSLHTGDLVTATGYTGNDITKPYLHVEYCCPSGICKESQVENAILAAHNIHGTVSQALSGWGIAPAPTGRLKVDIIASVPKIPAITGTLR